MEKLVRGTLIPYCYRSIALKPSASVKAQMEAFKAAKPNKPGAGGEEARAAREPSTTGMAPGGREAETEVVYNICNEALDEDDFGEALAACPQVLELFGDQMRCIMYQQNKQLQEETERARLKAAASAKRYNILGLGPGKKEEDEEQAQGQPEEEGEEGEKVEEVETMEEIVTNSRS